MNESTERIRRIFDAEAPRYDRQIRAMEWPLFSGGREWAASRVHGDVPRRSTGRPIASSCVRELEHRWAELDPGDAPTRDRHRDRAEPSALLPEGPAP